MMQDLPAELRLAILEHLSVSSLSNLSSVCHFWKEFIDENEGIIFRNAAVLHGYTSPSKLLSDLDSLYSRRSLIGIDSWKALCRRRVHIERGWTGTNASCIIQHRANGSSVHRIKVDEKAGFIITTSSTRGLIVADLDTDEVLWSLDPTYVRQYAHIEYDSGYLVFDRRGTGKEIWRLSSACDLANSPRTSVSADQTQASSRSSVKHASTSPCGHFTPWAMLQIPEQTSAYRFVYPTLLVAGWNTVYLFDVRSGELVQTIRETQQLGVLAPLGPLTYVELSARHAFVCGQSVRVFARASGSCVLDIRDSQSIYARWRYAIKPTVVSPKPGCVLVEHEVACYPSVEEVDDGHPLFNDAFAAAHVSSCGRHLVALLGFSRLIVVPNFERAIGGNVNVRDIALDIQLGSAVRRSQYLAYENGRVAIASDSGLYIVHLGDLDTEVDQRYEPRQIRVARAPWFGDRSLTCHISCLQMTDTSLFLNWCSTARPDIAKLDEVFYEGLDDQPYLNQDLVAWEEEEELEPANSMVCSIEFLPLEARLPAANARVLAP